jgi:hypothetical protein
VNQGDAGEELRGGEGEQDGGAEQVAGDDHRALAAAVCQDAGVEG